MGNAYSENNLCLNCQSIGYTSSDPYPSPPNLHRRTVEKSGSRRRTSTSSSRSVKPVVSSTCASTQVQNVSWSGMHYSTKRGAGGDNRRNQITTNVAAILSDPTPRRRLHVMWCGACACFSFSEMRCVCMLLFSSPTCPYTI